MHREGQVRVCLPIASVYAGNDKAVLEGTLGWKVYASMSKVGIEHTEITVLTAFELGKVILADVKCVMVLLRVDNLRFPFFHRLIEKSVADKVDKSVLIHSWSIIGKEVWMLLDEADHIVVPLNRWLETAQAISCNDELVTWDFMTVVVQSHIRGIAQAVTLVMRVACIYQDLLYAESVLEVVV